MTYYAETLKYEHGLPELRNALVAFADLRESTKLAESLGPMRFYTEVLRPFYESLRTAAVTVSAIFPEWYSYGPRWAGDGALFALLSPKNAPEPGDLKKFVEVLQWWGYYTWDRFRDTVHTPQFGVGIAKGEVLLAREPSIIGYDKSGKSVPPLVYEELVGYTVNRAAKFSKGVSDPSAMFSWIIKVQCASDAEEHELRNVRSGFNIMERVHWDREKEYLVAAITFTTRPRSRRRTDRG